MALFVDLAALSNGLHGSVQMDSVALFLWIGWLRHHGILNLLKTKLYLDSIVQNARTRTIKRGQVYRCNFGCGIGSEMQKERPALIIQNNIANSRSGNTIVISITHDNSTLPCVASITPQIDSMGTTI